MSNGVSHGDLILFDCPRIRKSEYWQFIKLIAPSTQPPEGQTHWSSQDATDAFCLKCTKMFRFVKGSSNSVRRHMERFHRKELTKHLAQGDNGGKKNRCSKKVNREGTRTSARSSTENEMTDGSVRNPPTDGFKRVRIDASEPRSTVEYLARWLCTSMRPLSLIEDKGFIDFIEAVSLSRSIPLILPDQESMKHRLEMMTENYKFELRVKTRKEVCQCSLTTEIWSSVGSTERYLVIACHYLSDEFVLNSYTLDVIRLKDFEAPSALCEKINDLLREWCLQSISISLLLCPKDTSVENACDLIGIRTLLDPHSVLDTLLISFITKQDEYQLASPEESSAETLHKSFTAICAISSFFRKMARNFTENKYVLEKLQAFLPATDLLKFFSEGSGDSHAVFELFRRIISSMNALDDFFSSKECSINKSERPNKTMWFILEGIVVLTLPLYDLMIVINSEKFCSLPFLLPCLNTVKQEISKKDNLENLRLKHKKADNFEDLEAITYLRIIRDYLMRLFNSLYRSVIDEMMWCSILDPRYGRMHHIPEETREICRVKLSEHALKLHVSQVLPTNTVPLTKAFELDAPVQGLMHRLLYDDDYEEVSAPEPLTQEAELAQIRAYIINEIDIYLNDHQFRKERIGSPLIWWQTNRERFPFLAPLARVWLGVLCSLPRSRIRQIPLELSSDAKSDPLAWKKTILDMIFLNNFFTRTSL